jgi:hypothetical protein
MMGTHETRPTSWRRLSLVAFLLGMVALLPRHALAESEVQGDADGLVALSYEGVAAYRAGKSKAPQAAARAHFEEAAKKLSRAYEVLKAPTVGLWLARAQVELGQLVKAFEQYRQVQGLPRKGSEEQQAMQQQAQDEAAREAEQLLARIPKLQIDLEGASPSEVSVAVDGVALPAKELAAPRLVDPGPHSVMARFGARVATQVATLAEGETRRIAIKFDQLSGWFCTRRIPACTALGLGAAGLVVGSVTGLLALSKQNSLDDAGCDGHRCPPSQADGVNQLNTLRSVSTVGFVVGAVGVAAGGALLLPDLFGRRGGGPGVSAWVGPGMGGVSGGF